MMKKYLLAALALGCGIDSEPILGSGEDAGALAADAGVDPFDGDGAGREPPEAEDAGCESPADCPPEHVCRDQVCEPRAGACTSDIECAGLTEYCAVDEVCDDEGCALVGACEASACLEEQACRATTGLCPVSMQPCDGGCHDNRSCGILADDIGPDPTFRMARQGCDDGTFVLGREWMCPEDALGLRFHVAEPTPGVAQHAEAAWCDAEGCYDVPGVRVRFREDGASGWVTARVPLGRTWEDRIPTGTLWEKTFSAADCECDPDR